MEWYPIPGISVPGLHQRNHTYLALMVCMVGNKSTVKVILCFSLFFLPSRAHCSIPAYRWFACSALQYILLTNHFPSHSNPKQTIKLIYVFALLAASSSS